MNRISQDTKTALVLFQFGIGGYILAALLIDAQVISPRVGVYVLSLGIAATANLIVRFIVEAFRGRGGK